MVAKLETRLRTNHDMKSNVDVFESICSMSVVLNETRINVLPFHLFPFPPKVRMHRMMNPDFRTTNYSDISDV